MNIKIPYMRLVINGERMISELQKDFTTIYPFLKIEFFKNGTVRQDRYPAQQLCAHHLKLRNAWNRKKDEGEVEINDSMTVLELENAFMDQFGLSAQVFRRSGNVWLETIITDNWTLKQQNDHGKEITEGKRLPIDDDFSEYDLNRDADH